MLVGFGLRNRIKRDVASNLLGRICDRFRNFSFGYIVVEGWYFLLHNFLKFVYFGFVGEDAGVVFSLIVWEGVVELAGSCCVRSRQNGLDICSEGTRRIYDFFGIFLNRKSWDEIFFN